MILKSLAISKINIFSNIFPYFHRYLMLLLMNSKECKQKTKKNYYWTQKTQLLDSRSLTQSLEIMYNALKHFRFLRI